MAKKKQQTYQSALEELETILQNLQDGNISVDDLIAQSTRAAELIKICRNKLRNAEESLEQLLDK